MNKIANENYYIVYYWMTGELGLTGITSVRRAVCVLQKRLGV